MASSLRLPAYKFVLLILDLTVVVLCILTATWIRFGRFPASDVAIAFLISILSVIIFQYNDLYKINVFLDREASIIMLVKSFVAIVLSYLGTVFITQPQLIFPSRSTFIYFTTLLLSMLFAYRIALLPILFRTFSSAGAYKREAVIIGAGTVGKRLAESLSFSRSKYGVQVLGFVDDTLPVGSPVLNGYEVVGKTETLHELVRELGCDEIIIAIDNISYPGLLRLIRESKRTGTTVKVVSSLFKSVSDAVVTESYTVQPAVSVTRGLYSPVTEVYQRIADLIIACFGLLVLLPFLLVVALAIKLTSAGPVFYVHDRIGKDGRRFKMFKFRSMYVDPAAEELRKQKMVKFMKEGVKANGSGKVVDESQVTPVGRFLRSTSLDEIPQLINVMLGQMSIVGPRPSLPYEYENMEEWQRERFRALPGCTGFWQVYGRGRTSFDEMCMMDIYMIENMSPWFYLQIVLKTIPVLILRKGAK